MSPRAVAVALAALVAMTGCGGESSSNESSSNATSSPAPANPVETPAEPYYHHHRHHRHAHGAGAAAAPQAAIASAGGTYPCNDAAFVAEQGQFASGALEGDQLVNVCGPVTRVLPSRTTRSGLHGYFFVQVAPNDTIEIVSDLGEMNAPAWPWVRVGDSATVRGRYYYDSASSQGIDWTHHGASASWPSPGYVVIDGTQYQ